MCNKQITFTSIYINDDKITNVIKEQFELQQENIISRAELVEFIKKYSFFLEKRYTVLSILKYNITGKEIKDEEEEEEDIRSEDEDDVSDEDSINLSEDDLIVAEEEEDPNFLTIIKNIDDICLENTASAFQDLNEIIILFNEKNDVADININKKPSFSQTKRIYINKKHNYRRTHRHRNI